MPSAHLRHQALLKILPRWPAMLDPLTLRERLAAQGFEISLRSIQRDLWSLREHHDIDCDAGSKPQRWFWKQNAAFAQTPALDPQSALTFKLVERYLRPLLPAATLAYLAHHFRLADEVLEDYNHGLAKWPEKLRVLPRGQPLLPPRIDIAVQAAVYQALLEERQLNIRYSGPGAREAKVFDVVHPLGVVLRDAVCYLVCTMGESDKTYQLALHRMRSATMTDAAARRPTGFELDAYIASGEFGFPRSGAFRLVARFERGAALPLIETPLSKDQKAVEVGDDSIRIEATVLDTQELRWWLQSFGDEVEVLKPVRLRREFQAMAKNMAGLYRG